MKEYFDILLTDEVEEFLDKMDDKARDKIIYNIDRAIKIREFECSLKRLQAALLAKCNKTITLINSKL